MIIRLKIKKGDTVLMTKGKDRGKKGKVVRLYPTSGKILVEGINERIRHTRPRRAGEKGQRVSVIHPVRVSNALIVCPSCSKGTRVGYSVSSSSKVRICKKCKAELG